MRALLIVLTIAGMLVAGAALREHYNTGNSPCDINSHWDCGTVNHSAYAMVGPVPVAAIGIAGYLLLLSMAYARAWVLMTISSVIAVGYSMYLTHIEAAVLQVWCLYCVTSLAIISLICLLNIGRTIFEKPTRQ